MIRANMIACGLALAMTLATTLPSSAEQVRDLEMSPGKGVSFHMGTKHGITTFLSDGGLCLLTVAVGDNPDVEGMNPTASTKMVTSVIPGKTARLETTDGDTLVFSCGEGASKMTLEMPAKATVK